MGRTASKEEVKVAFVSLSKKYHPDVNPDLVSASRSFVEINEAYSVLGNVARRQQYDMELHTAETYRAEVFSNSGVNPAGSPRQTSFSGSFYDSPYPFTHGGNYSYGFHGDEVDWEAYKKARQPKHTRVVLSLVTLMVVAATVQFLRIHWAHRSYQEQSDLETRRNRDVYEQVRQRAENSSVQEQLELLSRRQSQALQKIAEGQTNRSIVR